MVVFFTVTSLIIFIVTMDDHLDELANNISSATIGNFSSNILDSNSSLSPVIVPLVEKKVITSTQNTPFLIEQEYSPYIDEGQILTYPGVPGKIITKYEQIIVNGKIVNTNKLSDNEIYAHPQKILIGIRKPLDLSFVYNDLILDENGCPTVYEEILPNRVATAYTADYGARTSTNKIPQVGFVAVNPKVIPYHSVLYIRCHNNSLSGVFVAEDTGGAMRKGEADIDVFMTTEKQCFLFGRQKIDIYILHKANKN